MGCAVALRILHMHTLREEKNMKTVVLFALMAMLVGCAPHKTDTLKALRTRSGKASIILREDGTIEITGINIEIVGSEQVILKGNQIIRISE